MPIKTMKMNIFKNKSKKMDLGKLKKLKLVSTRKEGYYDDYFGTYMGGLHDITNSKRHIATNARVYENYRKNNNIKNKTNNVGFLTNSYILYYIKKEPNFNKWYISKTYDDRNYGNYKLGSFLTNEDYTNRKKKSETIKNRINIKTELDDLWITFYLKKLLKPFLPKIFLKIFGSDALKFFNIDYLLGTKQISHFVILIHALSKSGLYDKIKTSCGCDQTRCDSVYGCLRCIDDGNGNFKPMFCDYFPIFSPITHDGDISLSDEENTFELRSILLRIAFLLFYRNKTLKSIVKGIKFKVQGTPGGNLYLRCIHRLNNNNYKMSSCKSQNEPKKINFDDPTYKLLNL